jgi:hypothetical protein
VQWYIHTYHNSKGIPIRQEWCTWRKKYLNGELPPPDGWERHENNDDALTFDRPDYNPYPVEGDCDSACYYKRADEAWSYWYPIPTHEDGDQRITLILASILSYRTRRAMLHKDAWERQDLDWIDLKLV